MFSRLYGNTLANNPQHLFVAAAGNQNRMIDEEDPFSSCSIIMPNVLCVANSNQYDSRSSSSNWGKDMVHVFAPGEHILSTYGNVNYGPYVYLTGTSMACPQVSGLAALILTMQKNLTGEELKSYIVQNVQKKAQYADLVSSGGLIDIVETIRAVKIESTLINLLFMKAVLKSMFFLACGCNKNGSISLLCNSHGKCNCKTNVVGNTCNQCNSTFYGFPDCTGNNFVNSICSTGSNCVG